jgi:recombination protein RecT
MATEEEVQANPTSLAVKEQASLVSKYAAALMSDERAKEFAATVSLLARTEPKIAQGIVEAPETFLTAMMACVHLDLMPNTVQQHAFIIPYNSTRNGKKRMELQFQVGYRGMALLARRSGEIKKLRPALVYEGDEFKYEEGLELIFEHKPNLEVDRNNYANVKYAYVVATLDNEEHQVVVMNKGEIEKVREFVKRQNFGKESPAWREWPERQALKTVIKFAAKQLPSSSEDRRKSLSAAAYIDSLAEVGKLKFNKDTADFERVEEPKVELRQRTPEEEAQMKAEAAKLAEQRKKEAEAEEAVLADDAA